MVREVIQKKQYSYTLGDTTLNFNLRTDIKSELLKFRELMERATSDINYDLAALDRLHES